MSKPERLLRSLLAVIHGDGGDRIGKVGLEQATNEALALVGRSLRKDAAGDALLEAAIRFCIAKHELQQKQLQERESADWDLHSTVTVLSEISAAHAVASDAEADLIAAADNFHRSQRE